MKTHLTEILRSCYSWMRERNRIVAWLIIGSILCSMFLIGVFATDQRYVVPFYLNVRSEGKYGTPIIATISRGSKVTVLASLRNGWRKVALNDGLIGYVNGRYLSLREPIMAVNKGWIYTVSVSNAFVRGDGLEKKVAVLKRSDSLESLDDALYQGKWIHVRITDSASKRYDGRIGYISKELVETVKTITTYADPIGNEGDWIEDFNVINVISVSGSGSGVGTLAPLTSSAQADTAISGTSSTTVIAPIVSSGASTGSGDAASDEINGIISNILR